MDSFYFKRKKKVGSFVLRYRVQWKFFTRMIGRPMHQIKVLILFMYLSYWIWFGNIFSLKGPFSLVQTWFDLVLYQSWMGIWLYGPHFVSFLKVILSTLAFTAFELPPNGAIGTRILEFLFHSRPDLVRILLCVPL